MQSRSANQLIDGYVAHLRFTDATRRRMEKLYSKDQILRKDLELLYAGLFLDAITGLERLIESMFIGLLCGRVKHRLTSVEAKAHVASYPAAWEIVLAENNFVDWFPYRKTQDRAAAFFKNGAPFSRIDKNDTKLIQRFMTVRNVIAHKSPHSERTFEKDVLGQLPLTLRERTPTGFLRSVYASAPTRVRYEEFTSDMCLIATKLG